MNNFDVIIIGAGIIGLSTAYKLISENPSLKICILEKENKVAGHQTGHNSGVIHSGIYYKPESLKAQNCISGYKQLLAFCDENRIGYEICGKLIIATEEKEFPVLQTLFERGTSNGLNGIKIISGAELKEREPNVTGIKGVFVPQTGIVDYKIVASKLAELIKSKGVDIKLDEEVTKLNLSPEQNELRISTNRNSYIASVLISCAGLYSDRIALLLNKEIDFRIIPFRGEYYQLKDSAKGLIRNLIYPVPDPEFPFLGVHFTRRMDGVIEAGPNAVLALRKEGYNKSDFDIKEAAAILSYPGFHKIALKYWKTGFYEVYRSLSKKEFVRSLQRLVPKIKEDDLVKGGSGVRAQACSKDGKLIDDFLIIENERVINVCNAPSPAATSSLAIGETISKMVFEKYFF